MKNLLAVFIVIATSTSVLAGPCDEDIAKLCASVPKNQASACLVRNSAQLSDGCKAAVGGDKIDKLNASKKSYEEKKAEIAAKTAELKAKSDKEKSTPSSISEKVDKIQKERADKSAEFNARVKERDACKAQKTELCGSIKINN